MSLIHTAYDLSHLNSFRVPTSASHFTTVSGTEDLAATLEAYKTQLPDGKVLVLGEGNNMLFTRPYKGLVLRPVLKGLEILDQSARDILVAVGAGENWDEWVLKACYSGWYGLENLSLIPGSVGAAPIQNIGAYGVELEEHFEFLEAWDSEEGRLRTFDREACNFGYRESKFKSREGRRFVITRVAFRLSKQPELRLDYGSVREGFEKAGGKDPMDLRKLIIAIRESKLPDTESHGNAGSFFKNPVISFQALEEIPAELGRPPAYAQDDGRVKIPAAWLIDKCGWKAKRSGAVGTWPAQPLVLVNYGGASGQEIYDFSREIIDDIADKTGIRLEREVRVIN